MALKLGTLPGFPAITCRSTPPRMSKSSDKLDRLSRESREGEAMAARRRRAAPKEMRDTLALIKTLKLLVKNKKMKLHTAARIASPYTTGASPDAITRRIVKGIKRLCMNIPRRGRRRTTGISSKMGSHLRTPTLSF